MVESEYFLLFFGLWVAGFIVIGSLFFVLSKLFAVLEAEAPDEWERLGRPRLRIAQRISESDIFLPNKIIYLQYYWLLKKPVWAKDNSNIAIQFNRFRALGCATVVLSLGLIYLMIMVQELG